MNGRRQGTYVLLESALPGRPVCAVGVLLIDPDADRAWLRMRSNFDAIADPDDAEVLEALEEHIRQCIDESGAESYLRSLEDSASNVVRVTERQSVAVDAFSRVLDRLYQDHVETVQVKPFHTHLPLFSLRAAAGGLGDEMESAVEDWVPAPEG